MRWAFRSFPVWAFASIFELGSCADDPAEPDHDAQFVPLTEPGGPTTASVTHVLDPFALAPGQELLSCYSWTLDNEVPLYVNAVSFANEGGFHHGNWFVVPDDVYEGPDGAWSCLDRGFDQFAAAQAGTVLFAQSTQAWDESMQLRPGAVVRIPAHSRIVGDLHMLNAQPTAMETGAWLTLDLIRPWDVGTVLVPLQLTYLDLSIPPKTRIRFSGMCRYPGMSAPVDIHYVLPHFHSTGNLFELEAIDFEAEEVRSLLRVEGYGADAVGHTFDPPLRWEPASEGLRFTCGYDNWHSERLHWGIGIDEMCVMLALVDAPLVTSAAVVESTGFSDIIDGVPVVTGTCRGLTSPRGLAYAYPGADELEAELYVPPNVDLVDEPPPGLSCEDADATAIPVAAPTLSNLRDLVFRPSCALSACHGEAQAAGLRLEGGALYDALMTHDVKAPTDLALVAPGDPEGSWLYRVLSTCEPGGSTGHMPKNMPVLLADETIAMVRAWIEAGAPAQ